MEIKYEDWDRIVRDITPRIVSDKLTGIINKKVLEFATQERDKCPKPSPTKIKKPQASG